MLNYKVNFLNMGLQLHLKSNDPTILAKEANHAIKQYLFKEHGFKDFHKIFSGSKYGDNHSDVKLSIETSFTGKRFSLQNNVGIDVDTVIFVLTINRANEDAESDKEGRIISYEMRVSQFSNKPEGIKSVEDIFRDREFAYHILLQKYADYRRNSFLSNAA